MDKIIPFTTSLPQHHNAAYKTILFKNISLITMDKQANQPNDHLGIIEKGALLIKNGKIAFVGKESDLSPNNLSFPHDEDYEIVNLEGRWISPALIDCHSHIIYGGNRAKEFEMRLNGASYEEIARAGGGIISTVNMTRALSVDEMAASALPRLDQLINEGLTTIEVKSGYGLDITSELNILRAARKLETLRPIKVLTTCLAAHATPAEYKGRNSAYIQEVVLPVLEQGASEGLIDAVDAFCENIAFSPTELKPVFDKAQQLDLSIKLHAEQLSNLGGAKMASLYGALSVDHLEYLDEEGVAAIAKSGTVAVILPGAFYTIHETQKPPIALLRNYHVPIALATDCNPGTSPLSSLLLTMNMAATLFDVRVDECLAGTTREAARALGLLASRGTLSVGKRADLAIWNIDEPAELVYRIGANPLYARYFAG